jgi:hypothetical protein
VNLRDRGGVELRVCSDPWMLCKWLPGPCLTVNLEEDK